MLDRLEAAFASQKEFISDAGHELRTPITIVRGHLELLEEDPAEREETIELVTDELDRMGRLVNDLQLLAKAQRPDFLQPEPIEADEFTRELFAKASALAGRDWRLGEVASGRIVADRQRLTQAVMNLSQNAVNHTSERDAVELGSAIENGHMSLWVRDTGDGRLGRRSGPRSSSASRGAPMRAGPTAAASASRSPRRSPRGTAAASSWTAAPARAPASPSSIPTRPSKEVGGT